MAIEGRLTRVPTDLRGHGTFVREDEVASSRGKFVESFPPPPILLSPKSSSAPVPAANIYRVLAACDLTDLSEGVLREAIALAHGHMPAELHLVTVVQKAKEQYVFNIGEARRYASRDVVESLMNNEIWKVGIPKGSPLEDAMKQIALHVCVGEPAAEILRLSRELMVDAIIVGCREHQGLQRRVWGSVSKTVMAHADCSVVLARPVEFVHGMKTPSVEPPRSWKGDGYHLQMHHYHV